MEQEGNTALARARRGRPWQLQSWVRSDGAIDQQTLLIRQSGDGDVKPREGQGRQG